MMITEERKKKLLEAVDVVCDECVYSDYCNEEDRCYNCPVRLTVNEVTSGSSDMHQFLVHYINLNNHLWGKDSKVLYNIRSLFNAYCLMKNIEEDTKEYEALVDELFMVCKMYNYASKENFEYCLKHGLD